MNRAIDFFKFVVCGAAYLLLCALETALLLLALFACSRAFAQGAVIKSGVDTNTASVNTQKELLVTLSPDGGQYGHVALIDMQTGIVPEIMPGGRLSIGHPTQIFFDKTDGTSINPFLWTTSVSTMTVTQASNYIVLNGGAVTTLSTYAMITSEKNPYVLGEFPLEVQARVKPSTIPESNATMEFGWMTATTNTAPTNGAFFRWGSDSTFKAVLNIAGVETLSSALTNPVASSTSLYEIRIYNDAVRYYIDSALVATIPMPTGIAVASSLRRLNIMGRVYTAASPPATAPQLFITQVSATERGPLLAKTWGEIVSDSSQQSAVSDPASFATTSSWANSATPGTCTLSNTAACVTALGGQVIFTIAASTATDSLLFDYTVPAGYQLKVKGITVACQNNVALTATGILAFFAGTQNTAISLATADSLAASPPVIAARRVFIGAVSFGNVSAAPIGSGGSFYTPFDPPLVVDSRIPTSSSGHFQIGMKIPTATGTTCTIQCFAGVVGYFE
jgi:hypothetical protein